MRGQVELWSPERVWARVEALARAMPGGAVATDGDGTLWSGDVGDDLFAAFLGHGRVEATALEALREVARESGLADSGNGSEIAGRIHAAYLGGSFPEERICELMTWCFAGWPRVEVRAFARSVVDEVRLATRLHAEMVQVLDYVRCAGIRAVLVSASPIDVVVGAASHMGFAEADIVASRPQCDADGHVLAAVERPIPYGPGKVSRLRERIGLTCPLYAAFGDNAFDAAMLREADLGVAVRPKARLRERAHEIPRMVELGAESAPAPGADFRVPRDAATL